jgi:hypothetical protein
MLITLLTDFGTRDTYVGVMKGVIKDIDPHIEIIDLTHEIPAQDIAAGAFALKTSFAYFPPGTVHLAVVDPGVGSARRPIAAHIGSYFYVCPDNGLLSYVLAQEKRREAVILNNTQYWRHPVSRTFHGRDIFAPAAAHLACGVPLSDFGTQAGALLSFPVPTPRMTEGQILCHVISVDVFGNVITDLSEDIYNTWHVTPCVISAAGQDIPGPVASYSDVPDGAALALFGSSGHFEVAVRNGSAARTLGLNIGDGISLSVKTSTHT